jgi:hypothetical protein
MNNPSGFTRSSNTGSFNKLTAGGSDIIFYYKVEDSSSTGTGNRSWWINGNYKTDLTQLNTSNYNDTTYSTNLHGIPNTFTSTGSTDNNIFKVLFVNPGSSSYNANTYLYCIIGLPMNANCYFDYIKATIN